MRTLVLDAVERPPSLQPAWMPVTCSCPRMGALQGAPPRPAPLAQQRHRLPLNPLRMQKMLLQLVLQQEADADPT